jgi:hypothetical protein
MQKQLLWRIFWRLPITYYLLLIAHITPLSITAQNIVRVLSYTEIVQTQGAIFQVQPQQDGSLVVRLNRHLRYLDNRQGQGCTVYFWATDAPEPHLPQSARILRDKETLFATQSVRIKLFGYYNIVFHQTDGCKVTYHFEYFKNQILSPTSIQEVVNCKR